MQAVSQPLGLEMKWMVGGAVSGGWAGGGGVLLLVLLSANLCMSSVNVVVRDRRRQGVEEKGELVEEGEVEVPNTGEYEDDNKPSNPPGITINITKNVSIS